MKKKILVLLIALLTAVLLTAGACHILENDPVYTQLGMPVLSLDEENNAVTWTAVENAEMYRVAIYRVEEGAAALITPVNTTAENGFFLPDEMESGHYRVDVVAVGSGYFTDSDAGQITFEVTARGDDGGGNGDTEQPPSVEVNPSEDFTPDGVSKIGKSAYVETTAAGGFEIAPTLSVLRDSAEDFRIYYPESVTDVAASFFLGERYLSQDADNRCLVIDRAYFAQYSAGAKIQLTLELDGKIAKTYFSVCEALPYALSDTRDPATAAGYVFYKSNASSSLTEPVFYVYLKGAVNSDVKAVTIDDVQVNASKFLVISSSLGFVSIGVRDYYLGTVNSALKPLKAGEHTLAVYTTHGKSEIPLIVAVTGVLKPYDVVVDADNPYPDVVVRWSVSADADTYAVAIDKKIDGKIESNEYTQEEYPQLFDGTTFLATGLVSYGDKVRVIARYGAEKAVSYSSDEAVMNADPQDVATQPFLDPANGYDLYGARHNFYISSAEDFKSMMDYFLLRYDTLEDYTGTLPANLTNKKALTFCYAVTGQENLAPNTILTLMNAHMTGFCEAMVGYIYVIQSTTDKRLFTAVLDLYSPTSGKKSQTTAYTEQRNDLHYGRGRAADFEDFAINDPTVLTAEVWSTFELYLTLERGLRPLPIAGSPAERIYAKALDVLREIVDDTMDDYQKVHAIYDWLGDNVIYDYNTATEVESMSPTNPNYKKFYSYNCFFPEGVFDDGVAVCNGIAAAFSILCNVEGIECYKVLGRANGVNHAWNKIKIGGYWYICDATWANARDKSKQIEWLSHDYLLMTTPGSEPSSSHVEETVRTDKSIYYAGDTAYDLYAQTYFWMDGDEKLQAGVYDLIVENEQDARAVLQYYTTRLAALQTGESVDIIIRCDKADWFVYASKVYNGLYPLYGDFVVNFGDYGTGLTRLNFKKQ